MMSRLLSLSFALIILSSCSFHTGLMTANLPTDFNQEIINQAEGQATTVHVFGIGGLDHKYLVTDAKKNLYANYPLKIGEAYANLVVDYRLFPYIPVFVKQVFVTADIVSDPSIQSDSLQRFFQPINEKGIRMLSKDGIWIKVNDEVLVVNGQQNEVGRVVRVLGRNKVLVTSSNFGEKKYRLRKFFLKDENVRFKEVDYHIGQSIPIEINGGESFGTIIGLNHRFLLLESENKRIIRSIEVITRFIEKEK